MTDRWDKPNIGADPPPDPQFARDLKAAFQPPEGVPPEVGQFLASAARARLASPAFVRQRRYRLVRRIVAAGTITAAAAAIAMVIWLGPRHAPPGASSAPVANSFAAAFPAAPPAADTTSILDAFALARQLDAKRPVNRDWDVDNDGLVDRRDVDALALRAVSLKKNEKVPT